MQHNKSLKFVPRFALHRTRLKPRRLAQTLGNKAVLIEYLGDRKELLPELAQLHFAEWGHFRPDETIQDRIESLERCSRKAAIPAAIVATAGPELIGSAMLVAHDMSTRKDLSPWVAGVFVKPSYRRSGIATELIKRIEQEAAALEVPRLYLYTDKETEFYSKRGWGILETCDYQGLEVTIMSKKLVAQQVAAADA